MSIFSVLSLSYFLPSLSPPTSLPQHGRSEFSWEGINLSMEDTTSILPRLKRNSNAYGIGALAKSSLSGVTRTMKERVTKPTAMAQGRVAHMIEWQNWGMQTVGAGGMPQSRVETHTDTLPSLLTFISRIMCSLTRCVRFMPQFAISEATLLAWSSMDGESPRSGSNQGSVAHLSEVNQENQILHHSSAEVWPHTYVSQGHYCLSSSDAWEPINNDPSGVASPPAGSYIMGTDGYDGQAAAHFLSQQQHVFLADRCLTLCYLCHVSVLWKKPVAHMRHYTIFLMSLVLCVSSLWSTGCTVPTTPCKQRPTAPSTVWSIRFTLHWSICGTQGRWRPTRRKPEATWVWQRWWSRASASPLEMI
uniref:Family with sequence similarity 131 member Bb n=1 Tax=Echeneis naucrates TaxID=173247 RepID=A0A665W8C8_ECHNA